MTGNDRMLGAPDYYNYGPGASEKAAWWILGQGAEITGIGSPGWNVPLPALAAQARESASRDIFRQTCFAGTERKNCRLGAAHQP